MGSLTICFAGACSHFRNVVPGIPHRVVLPDATALRFGLAEMPDQHTYPYALMPHFPALSASCGGERLFLRKAMMDGNITNGIRLQVANAFGHAIRYVDWDGPGGIMPPISRYVAHYQLSQEVVVGGRAMCYFDLTNGTVEARKNAETHAVEAWVTIETVGAPILMASPIVSATDDFPTVTWIELDAHTTLTVSHLGVACDQSDSLDFLLNYLTASGGIPRRFRQRPPGFHGRAPREIDMPAVASQLATIHYPNDHPFTVPPCDVSAACSNTGYP